MALIAQQVRTLRLEIEELSRENAKLSAQVAAARSNGETQAQITNLSSAIETLRREYKSADETVKKQIIQEVSSQINVLASETQKALSSVASAVDSPSNNQETIRFSDDYPKTGKPYVVCSGDTLSQIAREHGSTIKFIQNANKIVNPSRDLRVGETIFIPVAQ